MRHALALAAVGLLLAGCGSSSSSRSKSTPGPPAVHLAGSLRLSSPAFRANGAVPAVYTCNGADRQLPLHWSGVPAGTHELVLVMRDPDAPGGDFVHWALAGISPHSVTVPANAIPGRNSYGTLGYRGPCPPAGKPHQYVLTLSALSSSSGLKPGFDPDSLRAAQLAIATLIGTYGRR